jgi:hypothetical protein
VPNPEASTISATLAYGLETLYVFQSTKEVQFVVELTGTKQKKLPSSTSVLFTVSAVPEVSVPLYMVTTGVDVGSIATPL